jgi:hypothetical protein
MPIIERTPNECFNAFAEHLRGLVAATVTDRFATGEADEPDPDAGKDPAAVELGRPEGREGSRGQDDAGAA